MLEGLLLAVQPLNLALAAVGALCEQRQSAIGVVVMLARHMRQIGLARVGVEQRLGKGEMSKLVGAPPFAVDKLRAQAGRYEPRALGKACERLSEADAALKGFAPMTRTLGRQLGERVILEALVTELIELAS